jgi:hypothetical protein
MSRRIKTTTILASLVLFGVLGCQNNDVEFDESLGLEGLDIMASKGLDAIESDLRKDGSSLADADIRPDGTDPNNGTDPDGTDPDGTDGSDGIDPDGTDDDRLAKLRKEALRFLRKLASEEECALKGILSGRYLGGGFKLVGHTWSRDLAGVAKGIYQHVEDRRGGVFKARYRDMSQGGGVLGGKFVDPGVRHDRFGAFAGDWTPADQDAAQGNIFGIWHPLYDKDDGVILGVWSNCNDRAVHRTEPVDSPDRDDRD